MNLLKLVFSAIGLVVAYVAVNTFQYKSKNPEKGWYLCVLNAVLGIAAFLKVGVFKEGKKMNLDVILQDVMDRTKCTDHGNTEVYDSYRKLIASDDAKRLKFTNVGYFLARTEYQLIFTRRLLAIDFLKKCPAVTNIPFKEPVFVFGLGRSGTTFLHRLLSLDPEVRFPRLWELLRPIPSVPHNSSLAEFAKDREARANYIRERLAERHRLGDDGFEKFHEVGYDLPEEDLFAMSDEIPLVFHMIFQDLYDLRGFQKVVSKERIVAAYQWHKKILQILMYQCGDHTRSDGPKRWVMKCPLHILWLPELTKCFPDAKLVWAHRHPTPTVTSLCGIVQAMQSVYYEKSCTTPQQIGQRMSSIGGEVLCGASKFLKDSNTNCAHVMFDNLVGNPIQTVKDVYKQFGWEVSARYEKILVDYLEENRKQREAFKAKAGRSDKASMHDHKPENFGLTAQQLSEGLYGEYIREFKITTSK